MSLEKKETRKRGANVSAIQEMLNNRNESTHNYSIKEGEKDTIVDEDKIEPYTVEKIEPSNEIPTKKKRNVKASSSKNIVFDRDLTEISDFDSDKKSFHLYGDVMGLVDILSEAFENASQLKEENELTI